jgi:hypothetical protein
MNDPEVSELKRLYPGWNVWRSWVGEDIPGKVHATRRRDLTDGEMRAGLAVTLPVGYTDHHMQTLREQLAEQSRIEKSLSSTS